MGKNPKTPKPQIYENNNLNSNFTPIRFYKELDTFSHQFKYKNIINKHYQLDKNFELKMDGQMNNQGGV